MHCNALQGINLSETVTYVGDSSFMDCKSLIEVSLPAELAYLGSSAFSGCESLLEITLPTNITEIKENTFYGCHSLSSSVLENNGITEIKENAFNNCLSFVDVVLPNNVTFVANNAFKGCANINKFTIGNGVETFDSENFSGWNNLEELVIKDAEKDLDMGENVVGELLYQIIKEDSYYYYDKYSAGSLSKMPIKKMYLGRSIKKSEYYRLHTYIINHCARMTSLKDLIIGPKVKKLAINDFYGCDSLQCLSIADGNEELQIEEGALKNTFLPQLYIGRTIKGIGTDWCFGEGVKELIIGHNLNSIGEAEPGSALESLVIGRNVTSLYFNTYENLKSITSYAFNPPSTYPFNDNAYINCTLRVPSNAVSNYERSSCWEKFWNIEGSEELVSFFEDSSQLYLIHEDSVTCTLVHANGSSIEVPLKAKYKDKEFTVTGIDEMAFEGVVHHVTINSDFESLPKLRANALNTLTINGNIGYLGGYIGGYFRPQGHLKKVIINGDVNTIAPSAFSGCTGLSIVEINGQVRNIGDRAFYNCSSLTEISINGDSASVDSYAFSGCTELSDVKFTNTFKRIGVRVFYNCPKLEELRIPASIDTLGSFDGCNALKRLYIEDGDKPLYFNAEGIKNSYDRQTIVLENRNYSLDWCHGAFYRTSLDSVYIGRSISYKLHSVTNNTAISHYIYAAPFVDIDSLKKVVIGPLVKDLGSQSDTIIEKGFFNVEIYDSHILGNQDTIVVLNPTPAIGASFTDVAYLNTTVIVPKGSVNAYKEADGWKNFENLIERRERYNVTYFVDNEVYFTEEIMEGDTITLPDAPEKEGYTWLWDSVHLVMPGQDITITGTFIINKYLVIFKVDGDVITADSLEYGAEIVVPEAPEKEGYTFDGWGEVAETVPANDVIIEGRYSVNSYLLTYTVNGETMQTDSVAYGTAITLLDEPIKEGHTFSGWSEAPETMPAEDVIISGTFIVNKYLVTFKIGDEVIASDSLEYGASIVAPEAPEKEGHTFNGWGEVAETVPASDVTYEGSYTVNIYKVYYYVGEELVHTAEVAYGEAIPEYTYEPEEGYAFLGWIGDTYEAMPAHDVIYTANIDDAIKQLTKENGQLTIYDLAGRKVTDTENLKGGIYIINGRKVVVK